MFKNLNLLLVFAILLYLGDCQSNKSRLTISNISYGSEGVFSAVYENYNDPQVSNKNFGGSEFHQRCVYGIYIVYTSENYTSGLTEASQTEVCKEVYFTSMARSLRFAGDPEDFTKSTLTFYELVGYGGEQLLTTQDTPLYDTPKGSRSLILTGSEALTIFSEPEYQGISVCILPQTYDGLYNAVFSIEGSLLFPPQGIKSFKFGCHTKNVYSKIL